MIVVVIIGVLAIALFPKLLGSLGKSFDEARKVELRNWETILLQYKSDNNSYMSGEGCLNESDTPGKTLIDGKYVDAKNFPRDPNPNNVVQTCKGSFYYKALSQNGIEANSYMIVAKMENKPKGNASTIPSGSLREDVEKSLGDSGDYYVVLGL